MAQYKVLGVHVTKDNENDFGYRILMPGEIFEPSEQELKKFPSRFRKVADISTTEIDVLIEKTSEAKVKLVSLNEELKAIAKSDEWEDDVIAEAKKLLKGNPTKLEKIEERIEAIENFLDELTSVEEEEEAK